MVLQYGDGDVAVPAVRTLTVSIMARARCVVWGEMVIWFGPNADGKGDDDDAPKTQRGDKNCSDLGPCSQGRNARRVGAGQALLMPSLISVRSLVLLMCYRVDR